MGLTSIALSAGLRVPVSVVWTTPGLALLPAVGELEGGFPAAVGAFVVVGVLVLLTGLLPPVSTALRRLPVR
jgi:benzoate membrane transport protein